MPRPLTARLAKLLPDPGPARALTYSSLVNSIGRGLFVTASVVFFHQSVGLSAAQVGLGMTIAAVVGLFAGVPMGHLADKVGPRLITVVAGMTAAACILCYLLVHHWWAFVLVASAAAFAQASAQASRGALIAGSVPAEQRVRTRAYLRAVTNGGWTIGAPLAGIALYYDVRAVYMGLIAIAAALNVVGALLNLRVPKLPPRESSARESMSTALRDRPFLTLAVLNAIMNIHFGIQNVAIPLWVVERTNAPAWVISLVAVINTVSVVALQVRASRGSGTVDGAARAMRRAGFLLLAACVLYALAAGEPAWVAAVALALGAAVHVIGELLHASGGWGLSYDLAPPHAQGQYQGLFLTGFQIADIAAPALLTTAVVGWGLPGWVLFGAIFAATGMAIPAVARWASRTRVTPVPDPAVA
ncbi:MAG TPA: MFS transporter [Stackebrandtia sp.]|jgi:MFS family permease|uniref:MFS transporter n=1 Tax=Stackebrandtia sp. TaxID=2023065 RepID=UPI002D3FDD00|nr:MFS transporter [Stackebrandtia sp.]HZE41889.1 MFS transporter [Stackebrandtia sp.]